VAEIEITLERKDHSFGKIARLVTPSPDRIEPECPNFGVCGGCDYLNINYDRELSVKKQIILDSLARIGRVSNEQIPEISIISNGRFNYRSHADIKCEKGNTGFFQKNSHILVPFPTRGCLLLSDQIIKCLAGREFAGRKQLKIAASNTGGCVLSSDKVTEVREFECGIRYLRDISCFFQANSFLRPKMLETVKEYAELAEKDSFLDIGCGVGFFTLYLSRSAESGEGIDTDGTAVKWARRNAMHNNNDNVKFSALSASDIRPVKNKYNVIIADPPRPGLSKQSRTALTEIMPERIVYVSCNPAAFARDSSDFITAGYHLKKLTLIDMFPATYHIEIIALFAL
jgi:tRNA/tmRNA/rRNA uracil-C5-methylase (TrmA/RlmC/RlmD family)